MSALSTAETKYPPDGPGGPRPGDRARAVVRATRASVGAWLLGLRWWSRRCGPRVAAAGTRGLAGARALLVAAVLAAVLYSVPVARAGLANQCWSRAATSLADRLSGRRVRLFAAAAVVVGLLLGPYGMFGALLLVPGLAVWAVPVARVIYPHTIRGRVRTRYGLDGWASWWELHRNVSAHAARQAAVATRPSLAAAVALGSSIPDTTTSDPGPPDPAASRIDDASAGGPGPAARLQGTVRLARRIERLPVTECGSWLGRSAVGPVWGVECYASYRDVIGLIAPPQTGKTALLGHHILDHCGAVVSTSTKPDLYLSTAAIRALLAAARRVELFNPEDLGGLGSTFRWSPVRGCEFPRTANQRAGHLVGAARAGSGGGSGGDDNARWEEWAVGVLAALLMSAASGGESMETVAHWVFTQKTGAEEALKLLCEAVGKPVPSLVIDALSQVTTTEARKTRDAIFLTLRQAVGFMADPDIAAICCPAADEPVFDVANFLADHGTLYILGSDDEHSGIAPLLAALTGYLFDTAKHLAAGYPCGRLDPPLMFALDEAALITPVPLDRWVADAGGRGIHLIWAVQSPSQLAQRWGARGADTIWNATNTKLVYGGLTLADDLEMISRLCGTRLELVPDPDGPTGQGHARFERVPVCPPDRVRTIAQWHALLIHRATPATMIKMSPYWQRAGVRGSPRVQPN